MNLAFLVARLVIGFGIGAHGAQKLFGWFGGYGLTGTAGFFDALGFRPGRLFALAAALGELGGGVLLTLGLLGPVGPALVILVMIVAATTVHAKHGFFSANNGVELPALYAMAALVLAFTGPGAYSVDRVLGWLWMSTDKAAWGAIAGAILGAMLSLAARRPQARLAARAA